MNGLQLGDCLEGMRQIDSNAVDLTVTSPPYDAMRDYGGHEWDFAEIATELFRITKPGGIVAWNVQNQIIGGQESLSAERQRLYFCDACGFRPHSTIYVLTTAAFRKPSKARYADTVQLVYIFSKGTPKTINILKDRKNKTAGASVRYGTRKKDGSRRYGNLKITPDLGYRTNAWYIKQCVQPHASNKFIHEHPALMPEPLAQDLVLSFSNPMELVLDPFAGAGTTARAAILSGRQYVGFEVHKPYYELAMKNIDDAHRVLAASFQ